jgi:hypothetical protein
MGNDPKVKIDNAVRILIQLGTQKNTSELVGDDGKAIVT